MAHTAGEGGDGGVEVGPDVDMGWVDPWVGLGWVASLRINVFIFTKNVFNGDKYL